MNHLVNKIELISALQAGGLGIIIGALFAFFGFKPPTPDNLSGIFGIIGIFAGWILVGYYFQK